MEIKKTKELPSKVLELFLKLETQELERARGEAASYENTIKSYETEVQNYKNHLKTVQEKVELLSKKETHEVKKTEDLMAKLRKHVCFDSVIAGRVSSSDYIEVTTKLLFSKIREAEGSKKEVRTCIGAYKIRMLPGNQGTVYATNITYISKGHWATSSNIVCLGDWRNDYGRAIESKDFYTAFEIITLLLTDGTRDAAAYMRSHAWRDKHRTPKSEDAIKKGDYVMALIGHYDGLQILGHVGLHVGVESGDSWRALIQFKKVGGQTFYNWYVRTRDLFRITKELYDACDVYNVEEKPNTALDITLAKMDALPNGSTQEDADEIIAEHNTRATVRLDLSKLMAKDSAAQAATATV